MDKRVKVIISIVVIVALILASYILIPLLKKNSGDSTVKISGKIIFDQYENGHIFIGLHSTDPLQIDSPPDIAKLEISRPGPYEIKVPKKTGRVYIAAVNSEEELREKPSFEVPRGLHVNNPIVIDASDIDGIDITLFYIVKLWILKWF